MIGSLGVVIRCTAEASMEPPTLRVETVSGSSTTHRDRQYVTLLDPGPC